MSVLCNFRLRGKCKRREKSEKLGPDRHVYSPQKVDTPTVRVYPLLYSDIVVISRRISDPSVKMSTRMTARFVYLADLVPVVEQILLLQAELVTKDSVVAAARAEFDLAAADATVGFKLSIARCKLRDAEAARDAIAAELTRISGTIPAPTELLGSSTVQRAAELRIKRNEQKTALGENAKLLDAAFEELKKGSWRRRGAPLPPNILSLQATEQDIRRRIALLDKEIDVLDLELQSYDNQTREREETYKWRQGLGPRPKWVDDFLRRERDEILRRCETIRAPQYIRSK